MFLLLLLVVLVVACLLLLLLLLLLMLLLLLLLTTHARAHTHILPPQSLALGIGGARPTAAARSEAVAKSLQQYVRCSAFVLLRMKICSGATAEFRDFPVRAMFVFLEGFVHRR